MLQAAIVVGTLVGLVVPVGGHLLGAIGAFAGNLAGSVVGNVVGLFGQVSGSPASPPAGAKLMQDALNWALWVGLILSGLAAAGGAGAIGVSRMGGQVNHSNIGKQVLMGGLIGAAGVGVAIPAVNMLFAAAKG